MDKSKLNIVDCIDHAGYEARTYSGRGMYGRECVGVDVGNVMEFIGEMISSVGDNFDGEDLHEALEELADLISTAKTDSMGLNQIVYFPEANTPDLIEQIRKQDDDSEEDDGEGDRS